MGIVPVLPVSSHTLAQAQLRRMVLDTVASPNTRRNYAKGLDDLFGLAAGRPLSRAVLMEYRASMDELSPSTINVRLAAVRKLVTEARHNGLLDRDEAETLTDIPNVRQRGARMGNWLTRDQARELLAVPDTTRLKGKRDRAILALLLGCALRRRELATLELTHIQQREGRWVIVDLCGKGGRIRTVAVPRWVKVSGDDWTEAAGFTEGRVLRPLSRKGRLLGAELSDWAIWSVVGDSARALGIENFGAHDLRRTCAKLCRKAGGDLEQIKFLLGHSSIQTTERYLGSEQEIAVAVNDTWSL